MRLPTAPRARSVLFYSPCASSHTPISQTVFFSLPYATFWPPLGAALWREPGSVQVFCSQRLAQGSLQLCAAGARRGRGHLGSGRHSVHGHQGFHSLKQGWQSAPSLRKPSQCAWNKMVPSLALFCSFALCKGFFLFSQCRYKRLTSKDSPIPR